MMPATAWPLRSGLFRPMNPEDQPDDAENDGESSTGR